VGLASQVDSAVSFQTGEGFSLSASEVFYLLNKFVATVAVRKTSEPLILNGTPYGPASESEALRNKVTVPWSDFARTATDLQDRLDKTEQIPSVLVLGSQTIPPESYLVGLAQAVGTLTEKGAVPDTVNFGPARLAAADYVADDSPAIWDWVIFPRGFHAPKLVSLAKLQAWTLKPVRK